MPNVIHFYGERGLVDSLFLDLQAAGKLVAFLNQIEFPFREPVRLGLPEDAEVAVILEAGFDGNRAGFGWPDAVVVVTLAAGKKLVLFIEAKAGLYADEAADFTARVPGFNSKVNGQLTLRFRLAQALRNYKKGDRRLVEPDDVARSYGEEARPRRLAKIDNLRKIVEQYLLGDEVECLFVALTDDDADVWPALEEGSCHLPFVPKPLAIDEDAPEELWVKDRNAWGDHKKSFGWVGFRAVEGLVAGGPMFTRARHFLDDKRKQREGRAATPEGKVDNIVLRTRWKEFKADSPTIRLFDRIRSIIEDAIKDTGLAPDPQRGSYGVLGTEGDRLLKVLPQPQPPSKLKDHFPDAAIWLGVNTSISAFPDYVVAGGRKTLDRGINNVPFKFIGIRDGEMSDEELEEVLQDIIAKVTADDESDES
jgi:hypothetical protein